MKQETYIQIRQRIRELIAGTEWESHVFCVGGCMSDEIMGKEIKDIDLVINLPSGGIRFAEWMHTQGYIKGKVEIRKTTWKMMQQTFLDEEQSLAISIQNILNLNDYASK